MTHIPAIPHVSLTTFRSAQRCCVKSVFVATLALGAVMLASGCAVQRDQETVGAYIDDTSITTVVKSRFFDNHLVDGTAISVETLNGTVMLSGFAKSASERSTAEKLAREVKGVKEVKNEITVRP